MGFFKNWWKEILVSISFIMWLVLLLPCVILTIIFLHYEYSSIENDTQIIPEYNLAIRMERNEGKCRLLVKPASSERWDSIESVNMSHIYLSYDSIQNTITLLGDDSNNLFQPGDYHHAVNRYGHNIEPFNMDSGEKRIVERISCDLPQMESFVLPSNGYFRYRDFSNMIKIGRLYYPVKSIHLTDSTYYVSDNESKYIYLY